MENNWIDIRDRIPPVAVGVIGLTKYGHEYNIFLRMDGQFQEVGQSEHTIIDSVCFWKLTP